MLAETLTQPRFIGLDAWCVFAMGQQNRGNFGKQAFQDPRIVDQHIAGRSAHEHFDPGHLARVEGGDGVEVVVAYAEVKAIVGYRVQGGAAFLVGQGIQVKGGGMGVGHVHEAGEPPGRLERLPGEHRGASGKPDVPRGTKN
jgi:hypothetical protein